MSLYVGLDVSQKETEICVVDEEGRRIWRGKCRPRPESITEALQRHAPESAWVGMERGSLAIWQWHGRISKAGDPSARSLLFEAANVLRTRVPHESSLRTWGLKLSAKIGSRRAKTALARKLAVILHRIWLDGTEFDPAPAA
jgi:hypothetical protein